MSVSPIHITGMPYVTGTVHGCLQHGTQPIRPDSIVLLRQSGIAALSARPAGLLVVDGAPFSHAMIALLGTGIPTVVITARQAPNCWAEDSVPSSALACPMLKEPSMMLVLI